jgi:tRNA(Ile)-lysidine synthase
VAQLRALSDARALNLLRYEFFRRHLPMPQRKLLVEALRQCREARPDAVVRVDFGSHALRCHRGNVELVEEGEAPEQGWASAWNGRGVLALPHGMGELHPRPTIGAGIARRHFDLQDAVIRGRMGGESMRQAGNRPTRKLKQLLQEGAVPPWERARMPLLFFGESLAWVPGVGVAAEFRAAQAEPGVDPEWRRS